MSTAQTASARMRALTFATTTAVAGSLNERQLARRRALLAVPAVPASAPGCIVCRDPDGLRCCEYGRDR